MRKKVKICLFWISKETAPLRLLYQKGLEPWLIAIIKNKCGRAINADAIFPWIPTQFCSKIRLYNRSSVYLASCAAAENRTREKKLKLCHPWPGYIRPLWYIFSGVHFNILLPFSVENLRINIFIKTIYDR